QEVDERVRLAQFDAVARHHFVAAIGYLQQPVVDVNTGPRRSEQDHGEDDHPHAGFSSAVEDDGGVQSPVMSCHVPSAAAAATASAAPVSRAAGNRGSGYRGGAGVGRGCPCSPPPAVLPWTIPLSDRMPGTHYR